MLEILKIVAVIYTVPVIRVVMSLLRCAGDYSLSRAIKQYEESYTDACGNVHEAEEEHQSYTDKDILDTLAP